MDDPQQNEFTPENLHRRQLFFQIYVPVIIAALVLITLVTFLLLSVKSSPALSQTWAHISLIMLVVPYILLFIVLLTFLSLAVFGLYKANKFLPGILKRIRVRTVKFNTTSQAVISKTASPVIRTRAFVSGGKRLFGSLKFMLTRARRK